MTQILGVRSNLQNKKQPSCILSHYLLFFYSNGIVEIQIHGTKNMLAHQKHPIIPETAEKSLQPLVRYRGRDKKWQTV